MVHACDLFLENLNGPLYYGIDNSLIEKYRTEVGYKQKVSKQVIVICFEERAR